MSPQMHEEMIAALRALAEAPEAKVLVLTGAGESWSAGQDISSFFRDLDDKPSRSAARSREPGVALEPARAFPQAHHRDGHGSATERVHAAVACDFRDRRRRRQVWPVRDQLGILPAGLVAKVMLDSVSYRDAKWYALTGELSTAGPPRRCAW